ncbi:acetate/propionate family kinase [Aliiroseovarius subalbicans]|uniref:acetate/propionate family kinase n=1 Tax=Aliiroseovarius subalbicans TaxID=2925840 RepID=UPI001F5A06F3|nr:acetate/propionate family kinase [Aliiroseovarius subalbicans]MCI2397820.1 acetate/propionate family kinase [Aliiroseovarius subalbicans]
MDAALLVINAGSSSVKFALFDDGLNEVLSGVASEIGGASRLEIGGGADAVAMPDHAAALDAIFGALRARGIDPRTLKAAAHRVVHGGENLTQPMRIDAGVLAEIAACSPLAPLHNPHNLEAIEALARLAPDLVQFASFDTSFHATNPGVATRYAIPETDATRGIRRYGFHGISYAGLVEQLPEISAASLPRRLLAFHLGNGASLCAIRDGKSVATTMGYSPLDGLTMGTRSGGIDANAVLKLVEDNGLEATRAILNHESGLLGLSGGKSDMRRLMMDPSPKAGFAVEHFVYWTLRHAGSLMAAMQGLDGIAFTGGIGENAADVRMRIMEGLRWTGLEIGAGDGAQLHKDGSPVSAWIVPAREEWMIARDAAGLLGAA